MGFFSKRKNENNGFIINTDDEPIKISGDKNLAPHAMTPDEVSEMWVFGDDESNAPKNNALDSLKKRMNMTQTSIKDNDNHNPHHEPSPSVKKEYAQINLTEDNLEQPTTQNDKKTLVERVKRYTVDEQGHNVSENQKPLYELESVAEILLHDSENAIKNLSKKYGIDVIVDDFKKDIPKESSQNPTPDNSNPKEPSRKTKFISSPTPAFEKMVSDSEAREEKLIHEIVSQEKKVTETPELTIPNISDIDTAEVSINDEKQISNTATIRFTPIKNTHGQTDHISISNITQHIDLDDGIIDEIPTDTKAPIETTDFDNFSPSYEYYNEFDGKKVLRKLAVKKRSHFLRGVISGVVVIALSFFLIPALYDFIISNPKSAMLLCSSFLFISFIANIDMLISLKFLPQKKCCFDPLALLATVSSLALGITAALTKENSYYITLSCAILLFVRSIIRFKEISAKHNNLKQILGEQDKNAVMLISDPATTFAMAKNAVSGDALIATHKKTRFINDFFKHYDFMPVLSGKISIVFFVVFILSVLSGLMAYFYYNNTFNAFYIAGCISIIAVIPSAFFIDILPLSSATKNLNKSGAMIAGIYGAKKIETANAATVNINDIFPEGTITMHNMKVLSNNNIDNILLRAASLTSAVNSPLAPIFKKIAGSNTSYSIPDSDTVKYEKNLGISGWVDNELLFIGNRSLMKAHGIEIPSLEVDKRILRKGYFPVYVATATAACALIVIQYNVDPNVTKQLHKITNYGITLLIENCDPNVTEEMICDYFDIYDDAIKIMSNAGVYMYKNATLETDKYSAPAAFKGSGLNFIKIVNCASAIKRCNRILTILYSIFSVFGILYFIYAAFSGIMSIPNQTTVLLYTLGTTLLSIIGFLIRKP